MTEGVVKTEYKTQKPLPSDDPERIYRIYNVISYFIILVVVGIPIWWYTTRVYRAPLPLEQMLNVTFPNRTDREFGILLSLDYDVLITIVNPDVDNLRVDVEGEDIEAHLRPFLDQLTPIADFVVKSQWLYLVELGAIPRKIIDDYVLMEEQLPHLITPLEKKLWSHLSPRPCLNLIVYVSHCGVPLFIQDKHGQRSSAFLSPRWGGIFILNPTQKSCEEKLFSPDVHELTSVFVTQLSQLLKMNGTSKNDLEELQRRKATEMIDSTRHTLQSLARLLSEISNIVISDDVAMKIQKSVENVIQAEKYSASGQFEKSLIYAKKAFKNSEAAFSDPSLLARLYFPDDQKYAIYIPLYLPIMIPVFISLFSLIVKRSNM